jgi:hypothetical protein
MDYYRLSSPSVVIAIVESPFTTEYAGARDMGRGILLWMLGIPIPVLILLYLFHVI